jgi:hypothetical protein
MKDCNKPISSVVRFCTEYSIFSSNLLILSVLVILYRTYAVAVIEWQKINIIKYEKTLDK